MDSRIDDETLRVSGIIHKMLVEAFEHRNRNEQGLAFLRRTQDWSEYVEEHCTLRLAMPRQSGNSVAAAHAAKVLGIRKDDEFSGLVVAPYQPQCEVLEAYGAENVIPVRRIGRVGQVRSIVADCATVLQNRGEIGGLVDLMHPKGNGWLVLIG